MNKSLREDVEALRDRVYAMDKSDPPDVFWWIREINGLLTRHPPTDGVVVPRDTFVAMRNFTQELQHVFERDYPNEPGHANSAQRILNHADAILAEGKA